MDHVNAGRIDIPESLFDVTLSAKKGWIVTGFPFRGGIENRLFKRESLDSPFQVIKDSWSHIPIEALPPSSWKC
jgi:hypothetical protein